MRRVIPYKTVSGALKALDNGGRFYNIFTRSVDGEISDNELLKAAGCLSGTDKAFLFFSLSLSRLNKGQAESVIDALSPKLRANYRDSPPESKTVAEFKRTNPGDAVILDGYPRYLENKDAFTGFIMIPISTGKTTSFTMVPIYEQYDVYELFADPAMQGNSAVIATQHRKERLASSSMTFGGKVEVLNDAPDSNNREGIYLNTFYYIME